MVFTLEKVGFFFLNFVKIKFFVREDVGPRVKKKVKCFLDLDAIQIKANSLKVSQSPVRRNSGGV